MNKEFIPYEQALALKELGFNEPCFGWFTDGHLRIGAVVENKHVQGEGELLAPTFSQAFRWFREKGYDVKVQKESANLYFGFYWTGAAWIIVGNGTYKQAELECLIKLIEIVKTK